MADHGASDLARTNDLLPERLVHGGERRRIERMTARVLASVDWRETGVWQGFRWMSHLRWLPRSTAERRRQSAWGPKLATRKRRVR